MLVENDARERVKNRLRFILPFNELACWADRNVCEHIFNVSKLLRVLKRAQRAISVQILLDVC